MIQVIHYKQSLCEFLWDFKKNLSKISGTWLWLEVRKSSGKCWIYLRTCSSSQIYVRMSQVVFKLTSWALIGRLLKYAFMLSHAYFMPMYWLLFEYQKFSAILSPPKPLKSFICLFRTWSVITFLKWNI